MLDVSGIYSQSLHPVFFQASSLRTPKIGSPDIKCLLKRQIQIKFCIFAKWMYRRVYCL